MTTATHGDQRDEHVQQVGVQAAGLQPLRGTPPTRRTAGRARAVQRMSPTTSTTSEAYRKCGTWSRGRRSPSPSGRPPSTSACGCAARRPAPGGSGWRNRTRCRSPARSRPIVAERHAGTRRTRSSRRPDRPRRTARRAQHQPASRPTARTATGSRTRRTPAAAPTATSARPWSARPGTAGDSPAAITRISSGVTAASARQAAPSSTTHRGPPSRAVRRPRDPG